VRCTSLKLPSSPSLRFNNLHVNSSTLAVFVEKGKARLYCLTTGSTRVLHLEKAKVILQARFISLNCVEYLAVVSDIGVHIFNGSGQEILGQLEIDDVPGNSDSEPSLERCFNCVESIVGSPFFCTGTSDGSLVICHLDVSRKSLSIERTIHGHRRSICSLASSTSYFASGDERGQVSIWSAECDDLLCEFPSMGNPCSSLFVRSNLALAAYASGVIRVYDISKARISVEIDAHCRSLNAMDIHPTLNIIATVAEDGYLNVWELPSQSRSEIRLISSEQAPNQLFTGVAFTQGKVSKIATTSYDNREIKLWS